jgi:hypothetical protein
MLIDGWMVTVQSVVSISSTLFIRLVSTTMPPRIGLAPSFRPVAPARGTMGMRRRLASLTMATTSSVVSGSTTTSGASSAQRWNGNGAGTIARISRPWGATTTRCAPQTSTSSETASRVTVPLMAPPHP